MSSKVSETAIAKLTNAIASLDAQVVRLTARLTGDETLQTTGLIHEVGQIKTGLTAFSDRVEASLKSMADTYLADFHETRRVDGAQDGRLDVLEKQNEGQAGLLSDLDFLRKLTDKGWKIATLFILGGCLMPLFTALWTKWIGH